MSLNQVWLFLLGWAFLAYSEWRWPGRFSKILKSFRWQQNILLGLAQVISFYLILGLPFWLWATWVDYQGWGLLPWLPVPGLLKNVLAILVFDWAHYGLHRSLHQIPLLWRVHRVHHTDLAIDVSTAMRFHPLETLLTGVFKLMLITLLGASRDAVIAFDVLYMLALLWTHANVRLPQKWAQELKKVLVTPSYHQLHHVQSPKSREGNYGFIFSFWDQRFGTISKPQRAPKLGLSKFPKAQQLGFSYLLKIPFRE
jgi:sterol desaturase/sphingolipid hydroxylase (fatty acid hydroxylase superfamily)